LEVAIVADCAVEPVAHEIEYLVPLFACGALERDRRDEPPLVLAPVSEWGEAFAATRTCDRERDVDRLPVAVERIVRQLDRGRAQRAEHARWIRRILARLVRERHVKRPDDFAGLRIHGATHRANDTRSVGDATISRSARRGTRLRRSSRRSDRSGE